MTQKIAIIGAGISGLMLAHALKHKAHVTVFEKARGVGGRMSTRYADPYFFDHGCQYFTAQSAEFKDFLQPFLNDGTIQEWLGDIATFENGTLFNTQTPTDLHYVATPNMNSLCKKLAENINVKLNTEIAPLGEKQPDGWHLQTKTGEILDTFDWVISTAPPKQTIALFNTYISDTSPLYMAQHQGCYTLMIGFNTPWQEPWKAAHIQNAPFQWIAINSTKPGRNKDITCLVAFTSAQWSEAHIDDDMKVAEQFLTSEFTRTTGIDVTKADFIALHRWRYATIEHIYNFEPLYDPSHQLASVSDWCSTSTIENVWQNIQNLVKIYSGT